MQLGGVKELFSKEFKLKGNVKVVPSFQGKLTEKGESGLIFPQLSTVLTYSQTHKE